MSSRKKIVKKKGVSLLVAFLLVLIHVFFISCQDSSKRKNQSVKKGAKNDFVHIKDDSVKKNSERKENRIDSLKNKSLSSSENLKEEQEKNKKAINLKISMTDLSPKTYSYLDSLGVGISQVKVIYGRDIHNRDGALMEIPFKKAIVRLFPNPNDTGIGVIDWEGETYRALGKKAENPKIFSKAQSEFLKAIKIAKNLRPKVKWGFYNIPFPRRYGKMAISSEKVWMKNIENNIPLIKESDILITSLYFTYQVDTEEQEEKLMKEDVVSLLKLAKEYSKESAVFIWHRNNYIKKYKHLRGDYLADAETMGKVPFDRFLSLVHMLHSASFQDKKIDAIIWWGADSNMYKRGNPNIRRTAAGNLNIRRAAAGNQKEFEHDYNETVKEYATKLMKSIKSKEN